MVIDHADLRALLDEAAVFDFLGMADHPPLLVVADHRHHGKLFADRGLKFHEVEPDGTVPRNQADPLFRVEELGREGIGEAASEAPE